MGIKIPSLNETKNKLMTGLGKGGLGGLALVAGGSLGGGFGEIIASAIAGAAVDSETVTIVGTMAGIEDILLGGNE